MQSNHWTFEGALWVQRNAAFVPLREDYAKHHRSIRNGLELRSTLRAGPYAWPGGYQLAFITDDGGLLCFDCVRDELTNVLWSIRNECSDGWRVIACDIMHDYESECGEFCSHCNAQLAEPAETD